MVCRLAVLSLVAFATAGCSKAGPACGEAWQRSAPASAIDLSRLERARYPRVETRLIAEVDRCYRPRQPEAYLLFSDEWKDPKGNRYLAFDIRGTTDIAFVAVVGPTGSIIQTGEASTNW